MEGQAVLYLTFIVVGLGGGLVWWLLWDGGLSAIVSFVTARLPQRERFPTDRFHRVWWAVVTHRGPIQRLFDKLL